MYIMYVHKYFTRKCDTYFFLKMFKKIFFTTLLNGYRKFSGALLRNTFLLMFDKAAKLNLD